MIRWFRRWKASRPDVCPECARRKIQCWQSELRNSDGEKIGEASGRYCTACGYGFAPPVTATTEAPEGSHP